MKTIAKFCVLLLMLNAGSSLMPQKASAQYVEVSYQVFYDQLSPYGMWVEDPNYGYVWVPNVGPGFRPYSSGGYWVMTEYGWTWVSRYRWGWAPFHYGRWYFEPVYGWIWVPGNEWGPAWVTWRRCSGYYGWTPMGPGVDITMSIGPGYSVPAQRWCFVRERDFGRNDIDHYYIRRSDNDLIYRKTAVITNTRIDNTRKVTYVTGPDKNEVQKVSSRTIQVLPIKEMTQPGRTQSGGQVQLYRPVVQSTNVQGVRTAPVKVVKMQEVKPVNERIGQSQQKTTNPTGNQLQQRQIAHPQNNPPVIQQKQQGTQPVENQQNYNKPAEQKVQQHTVTPPIHQQQAQPIQRTNPQGKTGAQPVQQQKTTQPVHQNMKQPAKPVKPLNTKPKEEPKQKEDQPKK